MFALNKVKDLVLDYAQKTAEVNCQNSNANFDALRDEFVNSMAQIRNQFPSKLFVNYPKDISEEDAKEVFEKIKDSVKNEYKISGIAGPTYTTTTINGNKIEIPSYMPFDSVQDTSLSVFVVLYDTKETKRSCLNQIVLNALLSLPIKKLHLTFVDLNGKFDAELLLRNLPPSIYNEHPITSDVLMESMLLRLEKRKENILTQYGDYPQWCKKNKEIPVPYEIVILNDESYEEKYHKRLNALIEFGSRIGVFFILTHEVDLYEWGYMIGASFFDNKKKEIYVDKLPKDFNKITLPPYTGLAKLVFKWDGITDVDFISNVLQPDSNNMVVERSGEYEVWLDRDIICVDRSDLFDRNLPPQYAKLIKEAPVLIGCFPSKEEAHSFILEFEKEYTLHVRVHGPRIGIYIVNISSWTPKSTLCMEISEYHNYMEYKEDLYFLFDLLELPKDTQNSIISILSLEHHQLKNNPYYINSGAFDKCSGIFRFNLWPTYPQNECIAIYNRIISNAQQKMIEKWGENYYYGHIHIRDLRLPSSNVNLHLMVKKKDYVQIPLEHYNLPLNDGIINFTPITNNDTLLKSCFDYIRSEADSKDKMIIQKYDFNYLVEDTYENDLSTMIIPVGKTKTEEKVFCLDLVSHVHSFIIGQSGSGKSVFLHNIIGGAMLKYAPEDLQLYLLDFKLGGVEFNRYKGAKHVKALLVDNSDPQVTLEILRELRGSMTERGKLLRSAGVNNIGEYNKIHQQDRMPHVLVVADECHEMFKADDSIPRLVRNEISDIVIKIAKEGRSQGVHLVFATQTLSGTEISSEIINNVSDFYLLKCAQTDSERLVPNSSPTTSELSTGQIYYHHVDEQVKFQAYYTDKEAAEKLMVAIVEKAKDHKSNGEFYFNGAQMFYLDESVKEQMEAVKGKSPVAFMGKAIDISQKDLYIKLNEDFSENVLLLGLNVQEQVTRTTMNLFVSLMMSAKLKHKDIAFKVIDCLNNEEGEVHELIFDLENEGYCDIIERRQRSKFFKELAQSIQNGTTEETILLILGQDRFRELKMDLELEGDNDRRSSNDDMMSISDDFFGDSSSSSSKIRTFRDALNVILDKGPDYGVHTLLQIEKASNLLFEDYITPKVVFQKFKHLVMLKADETAGVTLHLNDDIRLEKLSSDWERLRAYYYAEESDSYTLFTPYMPSKSKEIINILNTL